MNSPDTTEIIRSLGRIEGKIESLISTQVDLKGEHKTLRKDLDTLNAKVNRFSGALAVGSFVLVTFKDKIAGVFG
jgi:hypothetical protein